MQTSKQAALLCALCLLGTGTALAAPAAPAASSAAAPVTQKAPASAVTSVTAIAHNYGFGEAISQVALRYPEKLPQPNCPPAIFWCRELPFLPSILLTKPTLPKKRTRANT